eukprot:541467-Rhodomonas_salina.2
MSSSSRSGLPHTWHEICFHSWYKRRSTTGQYRASRGSSGRGSSALQSRRHDYTSSLQFGSGACFLVCDCTALAGSVCIGVHECVHWCA